MENIIRVFRPWLDADPDLEICWSDKFHYVCIDKYSTDNVEVFCQFAEDKQKLLSVICVWFFDRAVANTWKGAAEQALKDMEPYTAQLPPEDADMVRTIMGLYAKFEDQLPRSPAPS